MVCIEENTNCFNINTSCYNTRVQYVPCDTTWYGAILKPVLNARDTDRTGYLRHDVAIAYEMARPMTKCRRAPFAGFTCIHAFSVVKMNYTCLKRVYGKFSVLSSAPV